MALVLGVVVVKLGPENFGSYIVATKWKETRLTRVFRIIYVVGVTIVSVLMTVLQDI